jgi:cytoskeletal protein CcmA (bactofilin family)
MIQIAPRGTFSGRVGIDVAEISGTFSGELTARKRLVVRSTGKVSGKVHYGKLIVEEGGELAGEVTALSSSADSASGIAARPAAAKAG